MQVGTASEPRLDGTVKELEKEKEEKEKDQEKEKHSEKGKDKGSAAKVKEAAAAIEPVACSVCYHPPEIVGLL